MIEYRLFKNIEYHRLFYLSLYYCFDRSAPFNCTLLSLLDTSVVLLQSNQNAMVSAIFGMSHTPLRHETPLVSFLKAIL